MRIEGSATNDAKPFSGKFRERTGTWRPNRSGSRQLQISHTPLHRAAAQETSVLRIDVIVACDSDGPQESMTCTLDGCGLVTALCKRLADNNGRLDPLSLSNTFAMACPASPPITFARPPLLPGASRFLVHLLCIYP